MTASQATLCEVTYDHHGNVKCMQNVVEDFYTPYRIRSAATSATSRHYRERLNAASQLSFLYNKYLTESIANSDSLPATCMSADARRPNTGTSTPSVAYRDRLSLSGLPDSRTERRLNHGNRATLSPRLSLPQGGDASSRDSRRSPRSPVPFIPQALLPLVGGKRTDVLYEEGFSQESEGEEDDAPLIWMDSLNMWISEDQFSKTRPYLNFVNTAPMVEKYYSRLKESQEMKLRKPCERFEAHMCNFHQNENVIRNRRSLERKDPAILALRRRNAERKKSDEIFKTQKRQRRAHSTPLYSSESTRRSKVRFQAPRSETASPVEQSHSPEIVESDERTPVISPSKYRVLGDGTVKSEGDVSVSKSHLLDTADIQTTKEAWSKLSFAQEPELAIEQTQDNNAQTSQLLSKSKRQLERLHSTVKYDGDFTEKKHTEESHHRLPVSYDQALSGKIFPVSEPEVELYRIPELDTPLKANTVVLPPLPKKKGKRKDTSEKKRAGKLKDIPIDSSSDSATNSKLLSPKENGKKASKKVIKKKDGKERVKKAVEKGTVFRVKKPLIQPTAKKSSKPSPSPAKLTVSKRKVTKQKIMKMPHERSLKPRRHSLDKDDISSESLTNMEVSQISMTSPVEDSDADNQVATVEIPHTPKPLALILSREGSREDTSSLSSQDEDAKKKIKTRIIVKKQKPTKLKEVKPKSPPLSLTQPEFQIHRTDSWIFGDDDFSTDVPEKEDESFVQEIIEPEIPVLEQPPLPSTIDLPTLETKESSQKIKPKKSAITFTPVTVIESKKKWGPRLIDSTYNDELRRQLQAEERRKKQTFMYEKLKLRKKKSHQDDGAEDVPSFDDYNFLNKYCIFPKGALEMYRHAFDAVDEKKKGWLSNEECLLALRASNSKLSVHEEGYLFRVMELTGYNISKGADFKLFSVLSALSLRIAALDKWMKNIIGQIDFKMLDMKLFMCKKLWECNVDSYINKIPLDQLCVDLRAGGISLKHEKEVRNKLGHMVALDLLDFLTYIPLFIMIHESVVDNPLNDSREK